MNYSLKLLIRFFVLFNITTLLAHGHSGTESEDWILIQTKIASKISFEGALFLKTGIIIDVKATSDNQSTMKRVHNALWRIPGLTVNPIQSPVASAAWGIFSWADSTGKEVFRVSIWNSTLCFQSADGTRHWFETTDYWAPIIKMSELLGVENDATVTNAPGWTFLNFKVRKRN